ncbi:MAG: TIM barrel protein [Candidatus Lokiarchaeota archaeon]|nr:TIM barrel protein [Candidatus Lokiarchaeota archaeon]
MALEKNKKSLVTFMAFPGPRLGRSAQLGEAPEKYLKDSIEFIKKTGFFNAIEVTKIKDPEIRENMAQLYKKYKFFVTYCAQPVQLINEDNLIAETDISSIDELERRNAVARLMECLDEAYEIGAKQFCFLSGSDPGTENGLTQRRSAFNALLKSIRELCEYALEMDKQYNRKRRMLITLETFDRESHHENMKGQLIGPSNEARELAEIIKDEDEWENFGLLYDLSHMFLLRNGYEHEEVDSLRMLAPYLNWIHIANSVTDKNDPLYGDTHVSMDYPNGAVTPEILADFIKTLNEVNFQGGVGFEIMPHGRQLSESVVNIAIAAYQEAAQQIDVNYALGGFRFKTRRFLPEKVFFKISEAKIKRPSIIMEEYENRKQRNRPYDANLLLIAADHPARYVTNVGDDPYLMGDRQQYIGRIVRCLVDNCVDGIMTTPDLMDDLMVLNRLFKEAGGNSFIDNKILIGCTNRGGLRGSMYEMDDRITAYKVDEIVERRLDGAKMMFRIDLDTAQARYSQQTIERVADMVRKCQDYKIEAYIEPLPVRQTRDGYVIKMDYGELIKTIGVATALGGTSERTWLKIPYVDNFEMVARSTSNPILLLGGASTGKPTDIIENFEKGIGAGPNVRGCMVGRNLLYPGYDDPLAVLMGVSKIVHDQETAENAVKFLAENRGKNMDYFSILMRSRKMPKVKEISKSEI